MDDMDVLVECPPHKHVANPLITYLQPLHSKVSLKQLKARLGMERESVHGREPAMNLLFSVRGWTAHCKSAVEQGVVAWSLPVVTCYP